MAMHEAGKGEYGTGQGPIADVIEGRTFPRFEAVGCPICGRHFESRKIPVRKRGQSHILTLLSFPSPLRQQVGQAGSGPHPEPPRNPFPRGVSTTK
jgi:hypothetical protein